jgi:hypothetical protein
LTTGVPGTWYCTVTARLNVVETLTVTDAVNAVKTGFEHETEKTVVVVSDAEILEPDVGSDPDSASPPLHVFAFCDDHVSDTVLFARIFAESAEIIAVGAFHAVTVTFPGVEPPAPEHEIEYVEVWGTLTVFDPDALSEPLQPPVAVHELASVEVQDNVTDPLVATSVADALSDTVGAGALDPPPPQDDTRTENEISVRRRTKRVARSPGICSKCTKSMSLSQASEGSFPTRVSRSSKF